MTSQAWRPWKTIWEERCDFRSSNEALSTFSDVSSMLLCRSLSLPSSTLPSHWSEEKPDNSYYEWMPWSVTLSQRGNRLITTAGPTSHGGVFAWGTLDIWGKTMSGMGSQCLSSPNSKTMWVLVPLFPNIQKKLKCIKSTKVVAHSEESLKGPVRSPFLWKILYLRPTW